MERISACHPCEFNHFLSIYERGSDSTLYYKGNLLFLEASNLARVESIESFLWPISYWKLFECEHLPSSITSLWKVTGWILLTSSVLYALFHYDAYFLCFLSHGNTNSLLDCVISNNEGKISNPLFYLCVCVCAAFINVRNAPYSLSFCNVTILIFRNNDSCCFINLQNF